MKLNNIICVFIIIVFINSCTAQKKILKSKEYSVLEYTEKGMEIDIENAFDIIVADITKGSMLSIPFGLSGLSEGTHFFDLSPQSYGLMSREFDNIKQFNFYKGEKDMKIECKCRRNQNYYIKNLKIEEGNYTLTYNRKVTIKGDKISVSDSLQNLLFKNLRLNQFKNSENIYFKDLEFIVIDLADTLNVKLKKVK